MNNQLFTQQEFDSAKGIDKLPFKCLVCGKTFYVEKKYIKYCLKHNKVVGKYCSIQCSGKSRINQITCTCDNCGKTFNRALHEYNEYEHHFCSCSCASTYRNTHKVYGTRRSKLELWIEEQLTKHYPNLSILFNDKTAINSELDIYIPSLKIAFELNGIFHYEPIFGENKFNQIKTNDNNKFLLCQKNNISLCIIDTSSQIYFKEKTSYKFLNIITNIIDVRLGGLEPPTFTL